MRALTRLFLAVFGLAVLAILLALGMLAFDNPMPPRTPVPATPLAATNPAAANSGPAERP